MSALRNPIFTEAEYLALESASHTKHEFYRGTIIAMAGASLMHDLIVGNTFISLGNQLRDTPCRVVTSDMRVKVQDLRGYFYPDIKVVCGDPQTTSDNPPSLLNPVVIIEVLSPSTEAFDRGDKFAAYQRIDSLQDYLLVAQDRARIEHYQRQSDQSWLLRVYEDVRASLALASVDCTLSLAEVYARVTFDQEG